MLINLRNALTAGKRLPYDAEVEYLESTGTQWIDTGVMPTATDSFYCRVKPNIDRDQCFWGLAGVAYCFSNGTASGNGTYWGHPAIGTGGVAGVNPLGGTDWHEILCQPSGIFVDGVQINTQVTAPTQSPQNSVALFARAVNSAGGGVAKNGQGRMSAFKVERNGVLVRDYIPVRVGTVGYLYDRVSGKLFGNAGTGDFVLGQDVVPVEYIESHGTERIDTGFKADNTCKFRIDMERRGGSDYWLFGSRNGTSTATDKSCLYASVNSSIGYAMMGSAVPSFNSTLIKYGKHMIEMSLAGGLVIDGDVSATYTASEQAEVFTNSYPMSIFTMYNGSSYFNAFAGRVYLFSITSGGVSRLNLLPVRVGTEGAMMDTLTRRIYRNAGTGAFTYGNDLKYPIPAE